MAQKAALELPGEVVGEDSLEEYSAFPPVTPSRNFASLLMQNPEFPEAVDDAAGPLFGAPRRIGRSEARNCVGGSLWLTSLQNPGVFEKVPMENVSRFGIQILTEKSWERAEMVLVSSPPGFCVQGSVVYCKKLPSDNYTLGIRLDAPVEHWIEALGLGES